MAAVDDSPRLTRLDIIALTALLLGVGWAYARTLAPGVTWAGFGADSGDLVTAAVTGGVPHPTGYPTYLLLAWLFLALPAADPAFRVTLISPLAALLALAALYVSVRRLAPAGWPGAAGAVLAALALGLAPLFWSQAVIAEVYALNACFCALLLLCALAARRGPRAMAAQGLLAGLALGNHLTSGLFVLAWLAWQGAHAGAGWRRRALGGALLGLAVGLLVYLALPLRAAARPPVNWGDARDLAGFTWLVSGALYRPLSFGLPLEQLSGRVAALAGVLLAQLGPAGLALALAGPIFAAPGQRRLVALTLGLAGVQAAFALLYDTADSQVYLIPVLLIGSLWLGLAAAALLEWLRARARVAAPLGAALLVAALLARAPAAYRAADASADTRAIEFARAVLAAAPPRALVLAAEDRDSFALWYPHYALGQRPDLFVLVEPLLDYPWYRANLPAVYPGLRVPEPAGRPWAEALAAANPQIAVVCRTALDSQPPLTCEPAR